VKVLRKDTGRAFDPARFAGEIEIIARLQSHNIVSVLDTGRLNDGGRFVVMELLRGQNLSQLLKAEGPLPMDRALDISLGVLAGLEVAHAHGVVHRDIKPGNVFVGESRLGASMVKVLDFGVAVDTSTRSISMEPASAAYGTALYMAPEQFKNQRCDGRADLYGVGLLLYRMLSGKTPFSVNDEVPEFLREHTPVQRLYWLHAHAPIPVLDIEPGLWEILSRLLEKRPENRFACASEVIDAIRTLRSPKAQLESSVTDPLEPVDGIAEFVGEQIATPQPVRGRLYRMTGPMLAVAAIILAVWMVPVPSDNEPSGVTSSPACTTLLKTEPSGALVRHGEQFLGTTPVSLSRPCHEVWLVNLQMSGFDDYTVKLRGHARRDIRKMNMSSSSRTVTPSKTEETENIHEEPTGDDPERSQDENHDAQSLPVVNSDAIPHGGMLQGI
jgi:serine/threonine protein kinase